MMRGQDSLAINGSGIGAGRWRFTGTATKIVAGGPRHRIRTRAHDALGGAVDQASGGEALWKRVPG